MKRIHFIGICGTGMGSLAGLFAEAGWKVTGSDTHFYPPMGDQLKNLGIPLLTGFHPDNLKPRPDAVVIGNVCTKENPEAQAALRQGIPHFSFPQALSAFFLKDKKPMVVAGTHGKTTTATLLAWVLESAGLNPGFLIGGVGLNFQKSYRLGQGDYFVVEGDEYDSAFFDKRPKFLHYPACEAILTSIEWDHVDIYPTFEGVEKAFASFTGSLNPDAILMAIQGSVAVDRSLQNCPAHVSRYGLLGGDYKPADIRSGPEGSRFILQIPQIPPREGGGIPLFLPLSGRANLENSLAVAGLCHQLGIGWEAIRKGFETFKGIKKRQEIRGVVKEVTVIDDFAHHPTAVRRTLEALKERFPGRRLIAVFEPRSNTACRNTHYKEYTRAFKGADRVILADPFKKGKIPEAELLDTERLSRDLMRRGTDAYAVHGNDAILEFILRFIGPGEVVAFFSNGDFGNIHEKLLEKLERRKITPDRKGVRSIKVKTVS